MAEDIDATKITFVGHPFSPLGTGEQLRSHLRAASAVHLDWQILDIFRSAERRDSAHFALLGERECRIPPAGIRIFHVNGDEVDNVLAAWPAQGAKFEDGYNIVVPAWELSIYPKQWAVKLRQFDEIWALSSFIQESLATAGLNSTVIGQAVESEPGPLLPRRLLGLRESAFVLLHFFDQTSYATRKNPTAVLHLFRQLCREAPFGDLQLVLKVKNGDRSGAAWVEELGTEMLDGRGRVKVIDSLMDSFSVRSLVAAADCFVSLHRAEGFGRGLGEAMALGRLALGTNWSGNMDFMTDTTSLLVRSTQVRIPEGAYPLSRGQYWAEPDVDHALELLRPVIADPSRGQAMAAGGQAAVLRSHSNRAVGTRMLDRLEAVVATSPKLRPPPAPPPAPPAPAKARKKRAAKTAL